MRNLHAIINNANFHTASGDVVRPSWLNVQIKSWRDRVLEMPLTLPTSHRGVGWEKWIVGRECVALHRHGVKRPKADDAVITAQLGHMCTAHIKRYPVAATLKLRIGLCSKLHRDGKSLAAVGEMCDRVTRRLQHHRRLANFGMSCYFGCMFLASPSRIAGKNGG